MKTEMNPVRDITFQEIVDARRRISDIVLRTPLIRFNFEDSPCEIYLKLENLQPIGSFKLRGAGNAMRLASKEELGRGVFTASAGNMAQGVAWNAQRMGVPCNVVVPDHAPETKLSAIRRYGAGVIRVPFEDWWNVMVTHQFASLDGFFIHPVSDPAVIAGNGTIGLEIMEDLPDVDAILVPYGGGGSSCGIATAVKAINPSARVYACEVETAAPLTASLEAGSPKEVVYTPSFVDGIGARSLLTEMWPLVSKLLDGSIVVSLKETAEAIRLLIDRNRVLAEGAGAVSVAAALSGKVKSKKIVSVVSGGNIDFTKLAKICNREW